MRRQPTFSPLDKSRRTFLGAFLTLTVLTIACAIFYIGTHVQAVNLGYKISQELQKKERLIEENKRLDLEIARLKSPTRIEAEAKKTLGLVLPEEQQVFYLSRWNEELTHLLAAAPEKAAPKPAAAEKPPEKVVAKKLEKPKERSAKPEAPPKLAEKAQKRPVPPPSNPEPARGKAAETQAAKVAVAAPAAKPEKLEKETPARPKPSSAESPQAKTLARKVEAGSKAKTAKNDAPNPERQSPAKPKAETRAAKKENTLLARIVEKSSVAEKSAQPKAGPALAYQPKEKVPAVMLDPMP